MPEFYFGRFDVRFRSVEALGRGEDFQILEVNGASAEAIHIWDPEHTVRETYRVLFEQFRLLSEIGAGNRDRCPRDRKSGVWGERGSGRVEHGGGTIIKK